jgi:hypothetical protein
LENVPLVSGRKRRGEGASAVRKSAKEKGEATQMKKMKTMTMMRMMMRMTMRMMMMKMKTKMKAMMMTAQMIPQVALTNGADHRLSIEDMGKHIYITNDASMVVVPYHEDVPLPIGFVVTVINNSGDPIDIDSAGNNIAIIGPEQTLSGYWALAHQGMATLIKVENGVWFLTGNVSDDS